MKKIEKLDQISTCYFIAVLLQLSPVIKDGKCFITKTVDKDGVNIEFNPCKMWSQTGPLIELCYVNIYSFVSKDEKICFSTMVGEKDKVEGNYTEFWGNNLLECAAKTILTSLNKAQEIDETKLV